MCSSGCNHCRFEGQTRFCISVVVELFHVPLRHIGLEERAQHDQISFLTRELRACARASYRYDVGNGIRSLARSIGRFL